MPIRYRCRHCNTEIGVLPFDADEPETIRKLHLFEIGEIDDYIEKNERGETTVHSICEHCGCVCGDKVFPRRLHD